jgi:hypothetical protein
MRYQICGASGKVVPNPPVVMTAMYSAQYRDKGPLQYDTLTRRSHYRMAHLALFLPFFCSAARVAVSKTCEDIHVVQCQPRT